MRSESVAEESNHQSQALLNKASHVNKSIKHVVVAGDDHASKVWPAPLVLVRPDEHVAWADQVWPNAERAMMIDGRVCGRED